MAKLSKYPIGAEWRATDNNGSIAQIYLQRRENGLEIWRWNFMYKDGSGRKSDWAPTYRQCYNEVICKLVGKPRFKRFI